MRNRGDDAWELRIYCGVDSATGQQRWSPKTMHGSRRYAAGQLEDFVVTVRHAEARAGTVGARSTVGSRPPRRTGHRRP